MTIHCACATQLAEQIDLSIQWLADDLAAIFDRAKELGVELNIVPGEGNQATAEVRWQDSHNVDRSIQVADGIIQGSVFDTMQALREQLANVYTERTALLNVLSAQFPSFLTDAQEMGEDWKILFMTLLTGDQASWHIHPRDVHILADVPHSTKVRWDGHDTAEKYQNLANQAERLRFGMAEAA